MSKNKKLPVHIYLCPIPLKRLKGGIPDGVKIAEVDSISASDPFRNNHKLISDKKLVLYAPSLKKIVRKYEIDDWGRIV